MPTDFKSPWYYWQAVLPIEDGAVKSRIATVFYQEFGPNDTILRLLQTENDEQLLSIWKFGQSMLKNLREGLAGVGLFWPMTPAQIALAVARIKELLAAEKSLQ